MAAFPVLCDLCADLCSLIGPLPADISVSQAVVVTFTFAGTSAIFSEIWRVLNAVARLSRCWKLAALTWAGTHL